MIPLESQEATPVLEPDRKRETSGPAPAGDVFVFPTSFQQRRLWFLEQLHPCGSAYSLPIVLRATGRLDAGVLEATLDEIVRRHEVLRTTFSVRDGEPVQLIWPSRGVEIASSSFEHFAPAERETRALEALGEEVRRPFELSRGPLFRARLWKLRGDDHFLLLNMHHAVADGWSFQVLLHELGVLYEAFRQRRPSPLPEPAVQYADYTDWQREWLRGEVVERLAGYWKRQLEGARTVLELPTDHPRPDAPTFQGAYERILLPSRLTRAIHEQSRREGVTPYMWTLTAFATLLWRYTARTDFVIGSPIANRSQAGVEELIGLFANTLALRLDVSGRPTFRELLYRVRDTAISAFSHQEMPFERLVEKLNPARGAAHNPLFQVMFFHQQAFLSPVTLPELTLQPIVLDRGGSLADLSLFLVEREEGIRAGLEYKTDLFAVATIRKMLGHLQTLLEASVSHPDRPVERLPLLSDAEKRGLAAPRPAKASARPTQPVAAFFEAQAEERPEAPAPVSSSGDGLSYGELNDRANRLAHYLRGRGVAAEVPVGVYLPPSAQAGVAALAILKAGGAVVPLDTTHSSDRLAEIVRASRAALIVSTKPFARRPALGSARVLRLDRLEGRLARSDFTPPPTERPLLDSLAFVTYTPGLENRLQGVMVSYRALSERLARAMEPVARTPDGRFPAERLDLAAMARGATTVSARGEQTADAGESDRIPIGHDEAWVLDENLEPAPIAVVGDLYVGGPGLARGYADDPALTAERFIPHPFSSAAGARLYRTGIRAREKSDGTIVSLASPVEPSLSAPAAVPALGGRTSAFGRPQDVLELRIAKAFEKVLGVRPVGTSDNFFDLGGHSFLALALFIELEKVTGRKLPLATLFEAPTVERLASLLRSSGWTPSWSSLVPIHSGGTRPPLFCVHAVGGNVLTYQDLARHLGPEQPVYGLQAAGLDGERPPHESVAEMASAYIQEVRTVQEHGPYALCGTSAGGLIAFEMARQLEAMGEPVGLVAFFDTHVPGSRKLRPGISPARLKAYRLTDRFLLHLGNLIAADSHGKAAYFAEKSLRLERRLHFRWKMLRQMPLTQAFRAMRSPIARALAAYVPAEYGGRVTLFRAARQPSGYLPDPTLGWGRLAGGGVDVHEVPGRHGALVYEPRVGPLAVALSASLSRAFSDAYGSHGSQSGHAG